MRPDIDNWGNGIQAPKSTPVEEHVKEGLARLEVLVSQNSETELVFIELLGKWKNTDCLEYHCVCQMELEELEQWEDLFEILAEASGEET